MRTTPSTFPFGAPLEAAGRAKSASLCRILAHGGAFLAALGLLAACVSGDEVLFSSTEGGGGTRAGSELPASAGTGPSQDGPASTGVPGESLDAAGTDPSGLTSPNAGVTGVAGSPGEEGAPREVGPPGASSVDGAGEPDAVPPVAPVACRNLSCASVLDCGLANLTSSCGFTECVNSVCVGEAAGAPGASTPDAGAVTADGAECENLACFDVFDCAIFHLGNTCSFTACANFVCVQ